MVNGAGSRLSGAVSAFLDGRCTMTALKQRMMADMKLHGLAPGTQRVYLKAVHRLAAHYMLAPDQLSEQQLRDYFTYLVEREAPVQQHAAHRDLWRQVLVRQDAAKTLADAQVPPRPTVHEAAGGARSTRSTSSDRLDSLSGGSHVRHADVQLRFADFRSARPPRHGHRQRAHGRAGARGQGQQGSPRAVAAADARTAARLLARVSPHDPPAW